MSAAWVALVVTLWLVVALLVVLVLGLIRRVGQLESAGSAGDRTGPAGTGPVSGSPPPIVRGYEHLATVSDDAAARVVLFLSSSCMTCRRLGGELTLALADDDPRGLFFTDIELVLVTDPEGASALAEVGASQLVTDSDGELRRNWSIPGTPFAVVIDETGVIRASGFTSTLARLRGVVDMLDADVSRQ
jgi:hypothetical protein